MNAEQREIRRIRRQNLALAEPVEQALAQQRKELKVSNSRGLKIGNAMEIRFTPRRK